MAVRPKKDRIQEKLRENQSDWLRDDRISKQKTQAKTSLEKAGRELETAQRDYEKAKKNVSSRRELTALPEYNVYIKARVAYHEAKGQRKAIGNIQSKSRARNRQAVEKFFFRGAGAIMSAGWPSKDKKFYVARRVFTAITYPATIIVRAPLAILSTGLGLGAAVLQNAVGILTGQGLSYTMPWQTSKKLAAEILDDVKQFNINENSLAKLEVELEDYKESKAYKVAASAENHLEDARKELADMLDPKNAATYDPKKVRDLENEIKGLEKQAAQHKRVLAKAESMQDKINIKKQVSKQIERVIDLKQERLDTRRERRNLKSSLDRISGWRSLRTAWPGPIQRINNPVGRFFAKAACIFPGLGLPTLVAGRPDSSREPDRYAKLMIVEEKLKKIDDNYDNLKEDIKDAKALQNDMQMLESFADKGPNAQTRMAQVYAKKSGETLLSASCNIFNNNDKKSSCEREITTLEQQKKQLLIERKSSSDPKEIKQIDKNLKTCQSQINGLKEDIKELTQSIKKDERKIDSINQNLKTMAAAAHPDAAKKVNLAARDALEKVKGTSGFFKYSGVEDATFNAVSKAANKNATEHRAERGITAAGHKVSTRNFIFPNSDRLTAVSRAKVSEMLEAREQHHSKATSAITGTAAAANAGPSEENSRASQPMSSTQK